MRQPFLCLGLCTNLQQTLKPGDNAASQKQEFDIELKRVQ